jgi:imidazolonepropionase-like amidohydrolase
MGIAMTFRRRSSCGLLAAGLLGAHLIAQPAVAPTLLFEHARLITGESERAVEDAAFRVEDGRIAAVGRTGAVTIGGGGRRIDLTGKTVMPALVNGHVHLGYDKGTSFSAGNFTRENLLEQLERYAYSGVGAVLSLGTDLGDLPFAIRAQQESRLAGGALFLSAGRGLAPPDAGPANAALRPAPYGVTTEAEVRAAVREQAGRGARMIKIWVDDRNGTFPKLSPTLYRAAIAEAHMHQLEVVAHVYYLADARALVDAGIDGFAHLPRDAEIDVQFANYIADRGVFVLPNLSINQTATEQSPPSWLDDPLMREVTAPAVLDQLRASFARRTPESVARARATYTLMERSVATLRLIGARIGFGTDGGASADHVHGFSDHRELELMVRAGMSPVEALRAATRTTADIVGIPQMGSLVEGAAASFVVLDADPLVDIRNTRRIHSVYLRGAEVDRHGYRNGWTRSQP